MLSWPCLSRSDGGAGQGLAAPFSCLLLQLLSDIALCGAGRTDAGTRSSNGDGILYPFPAFLGRKGAVTGRVYNPPEQSSGHGYSHLFLNLENLCLGRVKSRLQWVPGLWQSLRGPKEQQSIHAGNPLFWLEAAPWQRLQESRQEALGAWPNQPCLRSATQPSQGTQRSILPAENIPANP